MCIKLDIVNNVPRYCSNKCYSCSSKIAKSHINKYQNRGCCFYYPSFNLVLIAKMMKSEEGKKTLVNIINTKDTRILKYEIKTKGYFDEEGYNNSKNILDDEYYNGELDKSIHFKACPFVKEGEGCTIDFRFRNTVCNLFICDEIKEELSEEEKKYYEEVASSYWKFMNWQNEDLKQLLIYNNVTLDKDFNKATSILAGTEIYEFEFPILQVL